MNDQSALRTRVPEPGSLQRITLDKEILRQNRIVGFDVNNIDARPFTLLRSQVLNKMWDARWKIIGITSPTPAVGKSFLATNLAAALSQRTDIVVYLLDLDFRRSSIAANLGIDGEGGLANYLAGEDISLVSLGRHVTGSNLLVFPTYAYLLGDTADLLVGERFAHLMRSLKALPATAVVICDLPPVLANDDAIVISKMLDAYMLAIEDGITTKRQVENLMRLLESTPCLGTVLNRYDAGIVDSYGYGFGQKYQDYYSD